MRIHETVAPTPLLRIMISYMVLEMRVFPACCHVLIVSIGCPISVPHAPESKSFHFISQSLLNIDLSSAEHGLAHLQCIRPQNHNTQSACFSQKQLNKNYLPTNNA